MASRRAAQPFGGALGRPFSTLARRATPLPAAQARGRRAEGEAKKFFFASPRSMATGGGADKGGSQHPNIGKFTYDLNFMGKLAEPMLTYRVLDDDGNIINAENEPQVSEDQARTMFKTMLRINVMDSILYEAQRQGRLTFYMTNYGEEATHIGSAAALKMSDVVFSQYREVGVLLWRGYTFQQACDQCVGNSDDGNKGRMMPVHYGSVLHNVHTISSPLSTQLPHAAGAAYSLRMRGEDACSVCYFGDGAASEGDFHGALNFAATIGCPVIFFCRNNGYAISTPVSEQYKGDGIAIRGISYNIETIRCDGNDVWAVYNCMKKAREIAVKEHMPVLIEAMTYRGGHHSTSDDATRYRGTEEVSAWALSNNPIARMRLFLERKGWFQEGMEEETREEARAEILRALESAEGKKKPCSADLFTDVYAELPAHLVEQGAELEQHLAEYGEEYPILHDMEQHSQ